VRIVTLRDDTERGLPGVEIVRLPRIGPRRYPTAAGLVGAVRGSDVVHVHGLDGLLDTLVARRAAVGAPIGVSTHGGFFHTARHPISKALWLRTVTRWALRRADAVWFTSESDRAGLAPAGVDGPVLPDGVDVARFASVVRRPEPGLVVVPGRIDVHKGLDDLLAVLSRTDRPFRLEIVGREYAPGLVARLRAQAASAGIGDRVRFRGELDDAALLDAFARAGRIVLPSRYEGFGIAAIEAMAARVPLVLSDIPAFRAHAGFARLVDLRAPDADVLGPLDPEMVERAAERVATFSWPARAEAWEAAYGALGAR
jgi:alpha-1,3-mannosyltransferase